MLVAEANNRDPQDIEKVTASMAARGHWSSEQTRAFRAHFEVEHLDTYEVGRIAAKAEQATYVTGVRRSFSGPVFAPDDLDRYCLGAGGLSRCD